MSTYNRTTTIDPNPGGDTVKAAVLELDTDLTGAYTALNELDEGKSPIAGPGSSQAFDVGNISTGGVTLSAWTLGGGSAIQTPSGAIMSYSTAQLNVLQNAYYGSGGYIYKNTGAASIYQQSGGEHKWWGAPSGNAGDVIGASLVTRMAIDSSGRIFVGPTTASNYGEMVSVASGAATQPLLNLVATGTSAFGGVKFRNGSGEIGSISFSASAVTYNVSSDMRLKEHIGVCKTTDVIDNLIIRDFKWKSTGEVDRGVFAQEAYEVKPSAVTIGREELTRDGELIEPWGVDYSKFVPDLIVYCQELKAKNASLEARLAALEASLA